jgi:hypothetical protein
MVDGASQTSMWVLPLVNESAQIIAPESPLQTALQAVFAWRCPNIAVNVKRASGILRTLQAPPLGIWPGARGANEDSLTHLPHQPVDSSGGSPGEPEPQMRLLRHYTWL